MVKPSSSAHPSGTGKDDQWVQCPKCHVQLKNKNLARHVTSKHGSLPAREQKRLVKAAVRVDTTDGKVTRASRSRFSASLLEEMKASMILAAIIGGILGGYFVIDYYTHLSNSDSSTSMHQPVITNDTDQDGGGSGVTDPDQQSPTNGDDNEPVSPNNDPVFTPLYTTGSDADDWWITYPDQHPNAGSPVLHHKKVKDALESQPVLIIIHSECAGCAQQTANSQAIAAQYAGNISFIDCNIYENDTNYELATEFFSLYDPDPAQSYIPLTIIGTKGLDTLGNSVLIWHSAEGDTGKTWIETYVQDAIGYYGAYGE